MVSFKLRFSQNSPRWGSHETHQVVSLPSLHVLHNHLGHDTVLGTAVTFDGAWAIFYPNEYGKISEGDQIWKPWHQQQWRCKQNPSTIHPCHKFHDNFDWPFWVLYHTVSCVCHQWLMLYLVSLHNEKISGIPHHQPKPLNGLNGNAYWWKKSCTSWEMVYPILIQLFTVFHRNPTSSQLVQDWVTVDPSKIRNADEIPNQ